MRCVFSGDIIQFTLVFDALFFRHQQVRIVYFDESLTANDENIMDKLGMQQYFAAPLDNPPVIQLTAAAGARVVNSALSTDPQTNNIFVRPVIKVVPDDTTEGATTIVAE